MQLTNRPTPPLGTWVDRSDLAGARAPFRDRTGGRLDTVIGLGEFADRVIETFDFSGDGSLDHAYEARRVQQHAFGSHRDGSEQPALFVWPNSTIRQEVVSIEPLIAAAKGADEIVTREELRALVRSFDLNGNGYLDSTHHGDGSGREFALFDAIRPVIVGARQMTVEGKLENVGSSVSDWWADKVRDAPLPPANA